MYPFQRNRYYAGKLLTSADFQAEQDYFNNKERFLNSLMYGSGIVCGLGVVSLDDLSILVESGVGIDGFGREIVQDTSVVKKLSAIEGFDQLETNKASLCIKYTEEPVHSVYAVGKESSASEYEYSRMSEGSKLFLIDSENCEKVIDVETEFLTKNTLYQGEDFSVEMQLPATVSKGNNVKLEVVVKKLTDAEKTFTLHCVFQLPGFLSADNEQEIQLDIDNVALENGDTFLKEIWLKVPEQEADSTLIILKSGTGHVYVNDVPEELPAEFEIKVLVSDIDPRRLVNREIGRMNLEMKELAGTDEYLRLADIILEKTDSAYVIDSIIEVGVKKYVATPANELQRAGFLDYYFKKVELISKKSAESIDKSDKPSVTAAETRGPEIATGILEIPLGTDSRKGDIRLSGEIMHGLGNGNVFVQVGFESVNEDALIGANARSTIYGNAELFRNDSTQAPMVETAVKILNDKGSFVVAAKLLENVDYLVLTFRWIAIRFPAGEEADREVDVSQMSIIPETPTVVLEPRESHFFGVRFENMSRCSIVYEVTEEGAGEITSDGVYTAPNKDGVFEIRIYCVDRPMICAYAYAIVKKRVESDKPAADLPIQ